MLSEERREWLLDALAALIAHGGPEPFVAAPLLVPTPRLFPDRWAPDAEGVGRLARRLLAYAQITDLGVEIGAIENPVHVEPHPSALGLGVREHSSGAAGCYVGIDGGTCTFGVDPSLLGDPEALTGVLAHEVAHVWRERQGLVGTDRLLEEQATDVTTVYLGFGILSANATYRYRSGGEIRGVYAVTEWSHRAMGYLSPASMCFLLAAQISALDEDEKRVRKWLAPTQAATFRAMWKELDPDAVAGRLGLPPRDAWPAPRVVDPRPFDD